ncbi:Ger(x)C family spore germination protein [Paenibacillus mucilaginosus]|uniref:Germination protein, Ger(X)C family n=1 Tax=Paenibacillus mucilaginosus (strain KNP414) TaxID=1036673 RepID=F8FLK1_PAEMK|nr:Ger(x)C family spore germination protein [Paenibacillus mucilaginosus]AEI44128.1 germination protein, Ger(x)C family [Paenibacillus mucilaginosus KNP414]MCG7212400.1 Ger(x)C family spore germination protein [Paenibacillus mucilaginosus]WDM25558.1 Ger(x)C family spore germination protein [Paenibacillus mucilaginosus]
MFRRECKQAAVLVLCLPLLTGCWDRREVNDVAFVSGTGIDKVKEGYRTTVLYPLAGQLGGVGSSGGGGGTSGSRSWHLDSVTGTSLKETNNIQQQAMSRQLYFAHRRVLVIGEGAARSGLAPILDIVARVPQNRMTGYILVTKGDARDFMDVDVEVEKIPTEMIRELALNYMRTPRTVKETVHALLSEGMDPALPYCVVDRTKPGRSGQQKPMMKLEGLAVFREDKLAGLLKGEEAQGVLWAMNEAKRPTIVLPAPGGTGMQAVQFAVAQTRIRPVVSGGKITMRIDIRARGSIAENQSNYISGKDYTHAKLEETLNRKIKSMVEKSLKALQTEYGSDPVGFGDILYRSEPKVWSGIRDQWREKYKEVEMAVSVHTQVQHTGTIIKPIGRKERMMNHE